MTIKFDLSIFYLCQRCNAHDIGGWNPGEDSGIVHPHTLLSSRLIHSTSCKWKLRCSSSFSSKPSEEITEISPESLWEVCDASVNAL